MTKTEMFRFLEEEARIGRLATVDQGGRPHVVPVWFKVSGDQVWVHTLARMRKARNVAATGTFALTVDTEDWPYRGVTMRGRARAAGSDEIDHSYIEDLTVSHLGEAHRSLGHHIASIPDEHTTLVLTPETWHFWQYQ